jgi:uncharacterized protein
MTTDIIIEKTVNYVKKELSGMESGHDWYHIQRVWKLAKSIQKHEKKANSLVVNLWALLHDIADAKFHNWDETIWPKKTRDFLEKLWVEKANIDAIVDIVENISFKKTFDESSKQSSGLRPPPFSKEDSNLHPFLTKRDVRRTGWFEDTWKTEGFLKKSLELQIVQDADRLDALWAVGIARAFTYGWVKQRILFDPEIKPKKFKNKEEYKADQLNPTGSTTINHFYEKLFLLKDMMNTKYAKKMAKKRHKVMLAFVKQFKAEYKGKR